jgi:uncharacterized membrane protein YgdD (TMEM256/DUF423 family)
MSRIFTQMIVVSCLVLAIAVVFGAFGAHALREAFGERGREVWETANRYHFYHGFAMLIVLMLGRLYYFPRILWLTAFTFLIGIICFSGSLYLLALHPEWRWLGPVTPLGGLFFLCGWLMAVVAMFNLQAKEK